MKLQAVQVFNVQFDTTDDGIEELSQEEITQLEEEVEGQIYEIDVDKRDAEEFEYALCEEITSQTGWLVNTFEYRYITIGN
jgi:hypothetical protein